MSSGRIDHWPIQLRDAHRRHTKASQAHRKSRNIIVIACHASFLREGTSNQDKVNAGRLSTSLATQLAGKVMLEGHHPFPGTPVLHNTRAGQISTQQRSIGQRQRSAGPDRGHARRGIRKTANLFSSSRDTVAVVHVHRVNGGGTSSPRPSQKRPRANRARRL